ncbi:pleckstrin homology domain-containing family J member 1 isoform X2 [Callithrix jacchus]
MRYNEKELQALSRQPAEMAAELGMRGPKKGSVLKRRLVKLVVNFLFYFRTDEAEPVGALLLERCRVTREEPGTFSISECGWGGQGRLQQPGAPAAPHCPLPRRPRPPLCPQPGATLPRHKSALSTASSRLRRGPREEVSLRVQQRGAVSGVDGGSPLGQLRVHAEKPHLLQERNPEGDRQDTRGPSTGLPASQDTLRATEAEKYKSKCTCPAPAVLTAPSQRTAARAPPRKGASQAPQGEQSGGSQ